MKYREIKKIKTRGRISTTNYGSFFIKEGNKQKELVQIELNSCFCHQYDLIDINEVYGIKFMEEYIIVSFKNDTTSFYKYDKRKILELDKQLYFLFVKENDIYIYIYIKEMLYRFNKKLDKIETFYMTDKDILLHCLFKNNLIFTLKGQQIFLYKDCLDAVKLSWQLDIASLFPDQEDITINEVKEYQGSLIVATSVATLRLSAEDGSVIWKSGWGDTLEIVGNTGYICTGLSLSKINLDTGEESGYGWEYHRLPDFIYEGKSYWPRGHEVVYHDGLLWYSVYSSGHSFLIAINPDNGNYEWIHHVDTYEKTDAPQFYEDKMFLYDTGNTLHIYEKEK